MQFIYSLGSNYSPDEAINRAKDELEKIFDDVRFTSSIQTDPIGIPGGKFTNCLATGTTYVSMDEMKRIAKKIEKICGDRDELRRAYCVIMDVDLLMYGHRKCHAQDWERSYIKTLMKKL